MPRRGGEPYSETRHVPRGRAEHVRVKLARGAATGGDFAQMQRTYERQRLANALPTSTDIINLNNSSIVVPNYLRITNGVTASASVLHIGDQKMEDGRLVGLKIEQGGTLNLTASGTFNLIVGNEGRGALWLDGGTVNSYFPMQL